MTTSSMRIREMPCFECGQEVPIRDNARRLCRRCYDRLSRRGRLPRVSWSILSERLIARGGPGDCWEWLGSISSQGYGKYSQDYAHRLSYENNVGPIPEGMHIDHLCRNRACVNPEHLEPVLPAENVRRGALALVACPRGHPYNTSDTYWRIGPDGSFSRQCRACRRRVDGSRPRSERTRLRDLVCSVEDCQRPAKTRAMCGMHTERARRGQPLLGPPMRGSRR